MVKMTMEELTSDMKYYDYYRQAYGAVLDGMVGTFQAEIPADEVPEMLQQSAQNTDTVWVTKYGLKAFFPLAKNFPYNDFDDFGVSRSYGFKRRHLGHDMMGQVGNSHYRSGVRLCGSTGLEPVRGLADRYPQL